MPLCTIQQILPYKMLFVSNRNPAPNWNPVSSPDVLDYIRISQNGLQPGQGLFKERSEFLESLPVTTRYTTLDEHITNPAQKNLIAITFLLLAIFVIRIL
jgi:hypothetical protein